MDKRKIYKINKVDVSSYIIRSAFEADDENAPEWFEAQAENFFVNKIFSQVKSVGIDELIDLPTELDPVVDPDTNKKTLYFVFHGDDRRETSSGFVMLDEVYYISVLVAANTGEAYAIESEMVE